MPDLIIRSLSTSSTSSSASTSTPSTVCSRPSSPTRVPDPAPSAPPGPTAPPEGSLGWLMACGLGTGELMQYEVFVALPEHEQDEQDVQAAWRQARDFYGPSGGPALVDPPPGPVIEIAAPDHDAAER